MHSKINNIEFMIYDNTDKVIEELFESLLNRYQIGLKHQMKGIISFLIVFSYCITYVIK